MEDLGRPCNVCGKQLGEYMVKDGRRKNSQYLSFLIHEEDRTRLVNEDVIPYLSASKDKDGEVRRYVKAEKWRTGQLNMNIGRFLLGLDPWDNDDFYAHYENKNTLDLRVGCNLKVDNRTVIGLKARTRHDSPEGEKGVRLVGEGFYIEITTKGRRTKHGPFFTKEEAARVAQQAREMLVEEERKSYA